MDEYIFSFSFDPRIVEFLSFVMDVFSPSSKVIKIYLIADDLRYLAELRYRLCMYELMKITRLF